MSNKWTVDDILISYRTARDKSEQISILAQLTATDVDTIIEIIKDANEELPKKMKRFKKCIDCGAMIEGRSPRCERCRKTRDLMVRRARYYKSKIKIEMGIDDACEEIKNNKGMKENTRSRKAKAIVKKAIEDGYVLKKPKIGFWKEEKKGDFVCSECGFKFWAEDVEEMNFCSYCGAEMKGGEKHDK